MTEFYKKHTLARLIFARRWLEMIQSETPPDPTDADVALIGFVQSYIQFLRHKAGLTTEYTDEIDCRCRLVDTVRRTDLVYEKIALLSSTIDQLPQEALAFLTFLNTAVLEIAGAINEIGRRLPQYSKLFAQERADYARIHEQWRREAAETEAQ